MALVPEEQGGDGGIHSPGHGDGDAHGEILSESRGRGGSYGRVTISIIVDPPIVNSC